MDTLSHGLWGGLAVGRKSRKDFLLAFLFGIAPDVLSLGFLFTGLFLGIYDRPDFSGPPDPSMISSYIPHLYNITHSLVVFAFVFGLVWLIRKRPFVPMMAWAFHILLDILTHGGSFFPTPFLWPISHFYIDGIPWATPWVFFTNLGLLVIIYSYWLLKRRILKSFVK